MVFITLCNELSYVVWGIPKHKVLIIGGDVNVQIGKDERNNSAYTTCQVEIWTI